MSAPLLHHSDDKFRSAMTRNHLTLKYSPSSGFLPSVALFIIAMSPKSVAICRIFINFVVSWGLCPRHNIFDESVFAFILNEKSDSFKQDEDNDNTHSLYSYVAMRFLCVHLILSKCGVLYRLFVSGFVRAFLQINGSQLHTFFLYIINHIGVV